MIPIIDVFHFLSKLAAFTPDPLSGFPYGAAKAAVINFTEFLNTDLALSSPAKSQRRFWTTGQSPQRGGTQDDGGC